MIRTGADHVHVVHPLPQVEDRPRRSTRARRPRPRCSPAGRSGRSARRTRPPRPRPSRPARLPARRTRRRPRRAGRPGGPPARRRIRPWRGLSRPRPRSRCSRPSLLLQVWCSWGPSLPTRHRGPALLVPLCGNVRRFLASAAVPSGTTLVPRWAIPTRLRGNLVRIQDCPAAVRGNETRHVHWTRVWEAAGTRCRRRRALESEYLPAYRARPRPVPLSQVRGN